MAKTKSAKKDAKKAATGQTFSAEERAAMRARAKELKAAEDGETAVQDAIAGMPAQDRTIAKKLHALIMTSAPSLTPKTWYGMPAYARDGKVVCFFQTAQKFNTRYATLGFSDEANLDEGQMWPTAFALKGLTAAEEARIGALVKKAMR